MLLFLSSDTYFDLCSSYLWVSENYVVNRSLYAVTRQLFVCVAAYGEELSEFSLSLNRHCSLALRVGNCTRANRYVDDSVYRLLHPCRGGGALSHPCLPHPHPGTRLEQRDTQALKARRLTSRRCKMLAGFGKVSRSQFNNLIFLNVYHQNNGVL